MRCYRVQLRPSLCNKMGGTGGVGDVHELLGAEAQAVFFPPGRANMALLGLDLGYWCSWQWVGGFLCIPQGWVSMHILPKVPVEEACRGRSVLSERVNEPKHWRRRALNEALISGIFSP